MSSARVVFGLLLVACLSANVAAECCKRKAEFGCCGSSTGTCNFFCCNCGGCDKQCEYTECAPFMWLRCSKSIGQCVDKCADKDSSDCKSCMGDQHESCKQCLVSPDKLKSAEGSRKDDLEKDRVAFFNQIAGGKDIPKETFMSYVKAARNLPGSGVDTSKPGTIPFDEAFKTIDPDLDGDIGRGEFDNDKLTIKLGDIILDDQPTKAGDESTTTAPSDEKQEQQTANKQGKKKKGRKMKDPFDDPFFKDDTSDN